MNRPQVSQLTIYPVKGMKEVQLESMIIGQTGPENDRRWMLVDQDGKFISQRTHSQLALIKAEVMDHQLHLHIPGFSPMVVTPTPHGTPMDVVIWKDTCSAVEQNPLVSEALSEFLKVKCTLVGFSDQAVRPVSSKYALTSDDQVSFADGFPFLVISKASLDDLNSKLAEPVPMNRFRPNIVIQHTSPFAEDHWKRIRIGDVILEGVKPCTRCIVTTIDQKTGERHKEPLKTLARYRNSEKGIIFGMNMIHHGPGKISVGDEVEILSA